MSRARITRARSAGGLELAEVVYTAGSHRDTRSFAAAEVMLVLHGAIGPRGTRRERLWQPGAVVLRVPEDGPSLIVAPGGARCFVVRADPGWRDMATTDFGEAGTPFATTEAAVPIIRELYEEFSREADDSAFVLDGLAVAAVGSLLRIARERRNAARPQWLTATLERLHGLGASEASLSELAGEAGVHRAHLSRAFREHLGCSIGEYRLQLRIAEARRVLRESETPLSDVALACGFADQSHFARAFKRATGTTPGAFRRVAGRTNGAAAADRGRRVRVDPVGRFVFTSQNSSGEPYTGFFEITGSAGDYHGVGSTPVMPELEIASVAVRGTMITLTIEAPGGVAVIRMRFEGSTFVGDWRLGKSGAPLRGHRVP